jgi:hypothetical protein
MASGCESNDRNDIYKNIGIAGALVTIALLKMLLKLLRKNHQLLKKKF